jgi:hypothetical protein
MLVVVSYIHNKFAMGGGVVSNKSLSIVKMGKSSNTCLGFIDHFFVLAGRLKLNQPVKGLRDKILPLEMPMGHFIKS